MVDALAGGAPRAHGRNKALTLAGSLLGALIVLTIFLGQCTGYDSRRHVTEAMAEAGAMKVAVAELYLSNGRWPTAAEGAQLEATLQRPTRAARIAWDAPGRQIVVTMRGAPYDGRRFALLAREQGGMPAWSCRPLDLDPKYLPAGCR